MTVPTSCKNFCAQLRRMGFSSILRRMGFAEDWKAIGEDSMNNAAVKMKWSERTCQRYLGTVGLLVKFGYLEVTEDGEYRLTGEDQDE